MVLALAGIFGIVLNFSPVDPIAALYWSAVVNGILAVPVMILLMMMVRRSDVMDRFVVEGPLNWLGWLATGIMIASVLGMAVSVLVENFFGLPFRDTGIDLGRIAELMEYGSAYAFVPAGRTDVIYGDALRRLPSLRRQVLGDLRVFRGGTMPRSAMLDGMLAADVAPDSDVVLEHELLTFFAAGAETSAATVGWAVYLLAMHGDLQARLRRQAQALAPRVHDQGWPALAGFEPAR